MRVKEVMLTKKIRTKLTVNQDESINNAASLMKNNKLSEIGVVDNMDKMVGTITKESILQSSDELNEDFWLD